MLFHRSAPKRIIFYVWQSFQLQKHTVTIPELRQTKLIINWLFLSTRSIYKIKATKLSTWFLKCQTWHQVQFYTAEIWKTNQKKPTCSSLKYGKIKINGCLFFFLPMSTKFYLSWHPIGATITLLFKFFYLKLCHQDTYLDCKKLLFSSNRIWFKKKQPTTTKNKTSSLPLKYTPIQLFCNRHPE